MLRTNHVWVVTGTYYIPSMLLLSVVLCSCCRDSKSGQEQLLRAEGAPAGSSAAGTTSGNKATGSTAPLMDPEDKPNPAVPHPNPTQQPQQQLQSQPRLRASVYSLQQQHGNSLLPPHHLPRLHSRAYSHGPLLAPLAPIRGLLGPVPVWRGGLNPAGTATFVWGFQQASRDIAGPGLLGAYGPASQAGNRYRGGQRGGGFSGM